MLILKKKRAKKKSVKFLLRTFTRLFFSHLLSSDDEYSNSIVRTKNKFLKKKEKKVSVFNLKPKGYRESERYSKEENNINTQRF